MCTYVETLGKIYCHVAITETIWNRLLIRRASARCIRSSIDSEHYLFFDRSAEQFLSREPREYFLFVEIHRDGWWNYAKLRGGSFFLYQKINCRVNILTSCVTSIGKMLFSAQMLNARSLSNENDPFLFLCFLQLLHALWVAQRIHVDSIFSFDRDLKSRLRSSSCLLAFVVPLSL